MGYQTVKSVEKALAILELLRKLSAENKVLTLVEVEKNIGIIPQTARNLLRTLEHCGYVRRCGHGQYEEGGKAHNLFASGGILKKLREVASPIINQTMRDIGESLLLVTVVNGKRAELMRMKAPDDTLRDPVWTANAEFYRMRTTRTVLAWFTMEQLDFFIERNGLPSIEDWPECEHCLEGLKRELKRIRAAGGCNDRQGGLAAIAVPVFSPDDDIIASLGCYSPLSRTDKVRAAGIFKILQDCATSMRNRLM